MDSKRVVKQLKEIEKRIPERLRLAAEGWDKDWKCLIAIMLSAQTRDEKTIEISEILFRNYSTLKKLSHARLKDIEKIIRSINYYKTKSKNVISTAKILYKLNKVPRNFKELIELPGVGRKTANVFLVEWYDGDAIGVDTHVSRIARKMSWTKARFENKKAIEKDLERLFPKKYWNSVNYILVGFGRTIGRKRKEEDKVLKEIKKIK